ncbi:MAG: hypothetical protein AB1439_06135 [candidate division FCPU426 bacterium]
MSETVAHPIRETAFSEDLFIHRGLVLVAGLVAGIALGWMAFAGWQWPVPDQDGIVGPAALGLPVAGGPAKAWLLIAAGIAGAWVAQWLWLLIAQTQRLIAPLPAATALKRAAMAYAAFFPQITFLLQGRSELPYSAAAFALLVLGFFLAALGEQRDKRKLFIAHPTETEYHPLGLFTFGAVIALFGGVGWFVQSLGYAPVPGLWLPAGFGLLGWLGSLLLAWVLSWVFRRHTFDQIYLALALAFLPLAILPLNTFSGVQYLAQGQEVGQHALGSLGLWLLLAAGAGLLAVLILALLRLRRLPVELSPAWEELFRALMLILAIPCLLLAVAFWPAGGAYSQSKVLGALDLWKDGEALGVAQAALLGHLPFKEILLRHGFLTDVVSSLTAISWLGPTVGAFRLWLNYLAPFGLMALYLLSIFCLPWPWALLYALVMLTGAAGTIPQARFFFPLVGFIFTLYYLQRPRWPVLLLSALFTILSLLASYTAGLLAFGGQVVLLAVYVLTGLKEWRERTLHFGLYLAGVAVISLPWWLYLAMSGSLGAYFQNFAWVLQAYGPVFGLPLPAWGAAPGLGAQLAFLLPPLLLATGVLVWFAEWRSQNEGGTPPWNVLLLLVLTGWFWMRFLGRGDWAFLQDALPLAAMLLAFFLYQLSRRQRRLRSLVFALALVPAFLPYPGGRPLVDWIGGFADKTRLTVDGLSQGKTERLQKTFLPAKQAEALDQVASYLEGQVGTGEPFYDFSNQPLWYFLVPRLPVVSALSTLEQASLTQQLEVIRALSSSPVKAVITAPPEADPASLDAVSPVVRQYAVAEYLLKTYVPSAVVGDNVLLLPRQEGFGPEPAAVAAWMKPLPLFGLPAYWGGQSKYDPSQGGALARYAPAAGAGAVEPAGLTVTAEAESLSIGPSGAPVRLALNLAANADSKGNVLVLKLAVPETLAGRTATLAWGPLDSGQRVTFTLRASAVARPYVFRLGSWPNWVWAKDHGRLVLELPGGDWQWSGAVLLQIADVPESGSPAPKP